MGLERMSWEAALSLKVDQFLHGHLKDTKEDGMFDWGAAFQHAGHRHSMRAERLAFLTG